LSVVTPQNQQQSFQSDGMSPQQPSPTLTHYLHSKLVGGVNSVWKQNFCVIKTS
jgi:hypothetical protein